jgi:hypothetical protein
VNSTITPDSLRLIRLAMLAGIVLFGGIAWYISSGDTEGAVDPDGPLGYGAVLLVLAAATTVMVVRRQLEGVTSFDRRSTRILVAAAVCEGAALLAGVLLLLSGSATPFLGALAVFLFSLLLLPIENPS